MKIVDGPYKRNFTIPEGVVVLLLLTSVVLSLMAFAKWVNEREPVGEVPRFYKTQ
jgi:hypothetical protein